MQVQAHLTMPTFKIASGANAQPADKQLLLTESSKVTAFHAALLA
jgi:hypothetical protein